MLDMTEPCPDPSTAPSPGAVLPSGPDPDRQRMQGLVTRRLRVSERYPVLYPWAVRLNRA